MKEGVTVCEECTLCYRTGLRAKPLIFALLEGLNRCEALRGWQVRRGSSGQLSLCECDPGLSKISLGSLTRTGYQLPCLLGGGHSLTCINTLWECVSFITKDQIVLVTRHPSKSRSIPPGAVQAGAVHVTFLFAFSVCSRERIIQGIVWLRCEADPFIPSHPVKHRFFRLQTQRNSIRKRGLPGGNINS